VTPIVVGNQGELEAALLLLAEITLPRPAIEMLGGTYDGLDTYTLSVLGGRTWATALRIKPRGRERVVLRGRQDFCLRVAHPGYWDIGSDLVDMEYDGAGLAPGATPGTGIKITDTGVGRLAPPRVRLRRPKVYDCPHQGILNTVSYTQILGGSSFGNGLKGSNKDHGLYLGTGSFDCLVRNFSTWGNAAYGVHEYGGSQPGSVGRNLIEGGHHFGHATQAGLLIGGTGTIARAFVSHSNTLGVELYYTARDVSVHGNMDGNRDGRYYRGSGATGVIEHAI
jgi:hypothetical protein